jgi:hypothetical protein
MLLDTASVWLVPDVAEEQDATKAEAGNIPSAATKLRRLMPDGSRILLIGFSSTHYICRQTAIN